MTKEEHDKAYPEHAKLRLVREDSQKIGAFLAWLEEEGTVLCRGDGDGYEPLQEPIATTCGRYFDVDPVKLSAEKDAMVEALSKSYVAAEGSAE